MQETQVWPQSQEDPLENGMATHSSILAWRIPWTEEPGGLSPRGLKKSDTTEQLTFLNIATEQSVSHAFCVLPYLIPQCFTC